jgi:hypothetical protein
MKLFADTVAPVVRSACDELFLIRFLAKPSEENEVEKDWGGAYVNCWVNAENLRTAEQRAIERLREELWRPVRLDHWEIVCRRCYSEDSKEDEAARSELLTHFSEALDHGISTLFHCWPEDAPDANDEPS